MEYLLALLFFFFSRFAFGWLSYNTHPITKRKHYCQNESRAIVLLCTQRGKWVHFLQVVFRQIFALGVAAKEEGKKYSNFRVYLPSCIRILQEHKEKD